MNKTALFYSLWCDDDISKSIRYIIRFILNIKKYNTSNLICKNIFIVLHTDEFSLNVIKSVADQESISLKDIVIKIHSRNTYLRGMSWRFESLYNMDYDICVNAEGDWPIENYEKWIQYFSDNKDLSYIIYNVRQSRINPCCFAGGCIFIRPAKIQESDRYKIKLCFDLILNLEHVHYGVDEYAYVKIAKSIFSKYFGLIVVNDTMRIFQHVENYKQEMEYLRTIFNNVKIYSIREFNSRINPYRTFFDKNIELKFKKNNSYIIKNVVYEIGQPLRVPVNDFCEGEFLEILDFILS